MFSDFTNSTRPVLAVRSAVESNRFGIKIDRMNIPQRSEVTDQQVADLCRLSDADLIVLRFPKERCDLPGLISVIEHRDAFLADELVYYSRPIIVPEDLLNVSSEYECEVADEKHRGAIEDFAQVVFTNYRSHYRANPKLNRDSILKGYIEWAVSGLDCSKKTTSLVLDASKRIVGFALVAVDGDNAEIELNGVLPEYQGRGVFGLQLDWLNSHFARRNVKELVISTQIENVNAIKAWIKSGFQFEFSLSTYHIMKLQLSCDS